MPISKIIILVFKAASMSSFSSFNFLGRRYFQSLALPSRFYPDAFQNFNYPENFFNFWQVGYCCFAAIKQRSQQNRHRRIFRRINRYFSFQLFPAVDYIVCHSKTIIMFLNFLANKIFHCTQMSRSAQIGTMRIECDLLSSLFLPEWMIYQPKPEINMKIIDVIPIAKGIPQEKLSYFTSKDVYVGALVSVPVRKKKFPPSLAPFPTPKNQKSTSRVPISP